MWKLLRKLMLAMRQQKLEQWPKFTVRDFVDSRSEHLARFEGGDNYNAMFAVRGQVEVGDFILIRMSSGRIGRYRVFSRLPDLSKEDDFKVKAVAIGYWDTPVRVVSPPRRPIKGLLGDGTRWVRSSTGELAHLPRGFTKPASEFWAILDRGKVPSRVSNQTNTTSNSEVRPNL